MGLMPWYRRRVPVAGKYTGVHFSVNLSFGFLGRPRSAEPRLSTRFGSLSIMTDAPAMAGCGTRSSAAFYADSLDAFLRASDDEVYAPLTSPHGSTLATAKAIWLEQLSAWRLQLPILQAAIMRVA